MSEVIKDSENTESNESPYSVLQNEPSFEEHMKNIENLKNDKEDVIQSGEATKMIKDEEGKLRLESDYLDVYYDYAKSDKYDPHSPKDRELGKAVWDIGMSSALLDLDSNFIKMVSGATEFNLGELDTDSQYQYKKAINGILNMVENASEDQVNRLVGQMEDVGEVGWYMAGMLDSYAFLKKSGELPQPYDLSKTIDDEDNTGLQNSNPEMFHDSDNSEEQFNRLEQEFYKIMSSNLGDQEAADDLYARYSELSKTTTDPKILETIEDRRNKLFSHINKLEELSKKVYFD